MTSTIDIRNTFLNYFENNDHRVVPSSTLVPHNDPTLMFTNSGMVQFKNLFTGQEKRDYQRAVTAQKVVRAGGKHNDLDNVGHTARHHTFFEMLGNFSFGDYFKEQAIYHAWTLLTQHYGLDASKLLVTIYHTDEEARRLWKKIASLSDDRIIPIATTDNFWSMGDTGPCGPCSEIFFDHGDKVFGGPPGSADEDGDRFIEIWNLVFMQYERFLDGAQSDLPRPSIDTGMGLERIAAVLQGKHDNYDIDLMRALIEASAQVSNDDPDGTNNVSHRVIADHLRSACFLIAEGVLPSNEGRGYVLRRIMRRAMRHAHMIGNQDPVLYKLVPALIAQMGEHYGELKQAQSLMSETLRLEETRFKKTIDRGLRLLDDETNKLADKAPLSGEVAFKLYDTYGFPLDLTQDILRGQGRSLDLEGFDQAMQAQKATARASWSGSGEQATAKLWFDLKEQLGSTEFLGYAKTEADAEITAIVVDDQPVEKLEQGQTGFVLTNQTPFYAESGGQQGDQGQLIYTQDDQKAQAAVLDTQKALGALWLHKVKVQSGVLTVGAAVSLSVDTSRRQALARHHSATHLLHEALRQQLGAHVAQRGSLVAAERLRFDFSHNNAISAEDLQHIEQQVNARVLENSRVETRIMSLEEAQEAGAMALFGEKYSEEVRVVMMGAPQAGQKKPYSMELCGGTHVGATGEIGLVKILSEENLAAGTRRVEAVAGLAALDYIRNQEQLISSAAQTLKVGKQDLPQRVTALSEERKQLDKELSALRKKVALGDTGGSNAEQAIEKIKDMGLIARIFHDVPARDLKGMADNLMQNQSKVVVVLISVVDGKASLVTAVSQDLCAQLSAVALVKVGAQALGGSGGGGRNDMAQAGGPKAEAAKEAVEAIRAHISSFSGSN